MIPDKIPGRQTLTLIFLFLLQASLPAQPYVQLTADRYNLNVRNLFPYSLRVTLSTRYGSKSIFLEAGRDSTLSGYYSRSRIKAMIVKCAYDTHNYRHDQEQLKIRKISLGDSLERRKKEQEDGAVKSLRNKVVAEFASKIQDDPNDTDIEKWAKEGIRKVAKGVQFYEAIKDLNSKIIKIEKYKNYSEFFRELPKDLLEERTIKIASELIKEKFGLEAKTSEYILKSVLRYFVQMKEIEEKYNNDLLSLEDVYANDLDQIKGYRDDASFSGKNTYRAMDVVVKPMDLRTVTPDYLLQWDWFCFGASLNPLWRSAPQNPFTTEEEKTKSPSFSMGGGFHIPLTREINFSRSFYSRIYGGLTVYNASYKLGDGISLSDNFFSKTPSNSSSFSISEPIGFEHLRLGGSLVWRVLLGSSFFFDLEGGYTRLSGTLNLRYSELSKGYEWERTRVKIVDDDYKPYFGSRFGLGFNRSHRRGHISVGVQWYKADHGNITDLVISETATNKPVDFSSGNKFTYRVNLGLSLSF